MLEAIQQNPLVTVIIILVPAIGITWRLLHTLYVKPRDFRISTLEKHVQELRDQALRAVDPTKPTAQAGEHKAEPTALITAGRQEPMALNGNPLHSLTECYQQWVDQGKTELQRKKFEETYTGKEISWEVYVDSVDKSDYWVTLWARSTRTGGIGEPRANIKFPLSEENRLLMFRSGDRVKVEGRIKEFFLNPVVNGSRIEKLQ